MTGHLCGQAVELVEPDGRTGRRFVAQCQGRYLIINHDPGQAYNGMILGDWRAVLRELVAAAVPPALRDRVVRARAVTSDLYHDVPLAYPLSVAQLAGLLGQDRDDVRFELEDLAVEVS